MSTSAAERSRLGNHWLRSTQVWVLLHTADPGADGTANRILSAGVRQATFDVFTDGTSQTTGSLLWEVVNATAAVTVTHLSLWETSQPSGYKGNVAFTDPVEVAEEQGLRIAAGQLKAQVL